MKETICDKYGCLYRASENGKWYCNKFHWGEDDLKANNQTIDDFADNDCLASEREIYKKLKELSHNYFF